MKRSCVANLVSGFACANVLLGVVVAATPAFANEGGEAGLPQMDASKYPGLLFWLAVCFSLLFLMMRTWIVPQIQEAQGSRRNLLDSDLDAARLANEKAQDMLANYERALSEARTNAFSMVDEIVKQSVRESEERESRQQAELDRKLDEAHERINQSRDAALREVPKAVDELVDSIVNKLVGAVAA